MAHGSKITNDYRVDFSVRRVLVAPSSRCPSGCYIEDGGRSCSCRCRRCAVENALESGGGCRFSDNRWRVHRASYVQELGDYTRVVDTVRSFLVLREDVLFDRFVLRAGGKEPSGHIE